MTVIDLRIIELIIQTSLFHRFYFKVLAKKLILLKTLSLISWVETNKSSVEAAAWLLKIENKKTITLVASFWNMAKRMKKLLTQAIGV